MSLSSSYDAVVIGAGPNGLAAAITLARAGRSVVVIEAQDAIGGGTRSAALTLPGFLHDTCSAIHPLGVASPFFRTLPLEQFGLRWIYPPAPLAHPLPDGTAVLMRRSLAETAAQLGSDVGAYTALLSPLVAHWEELLEGILGPLRPLHQARHPLSSLALARFGLSAIQSVQSLTQRRFTGEAARALFAGMGAHSFLPVEQAPSAAFALMLALLGHVVGWPLAHGGSQAIADAMAAYLRSLGGEIQTGWEVTSLDELPPTRAILADLTPRQLLAIAGKRLPDGYRKRLQRYRYGPGVFKLDFALDGPIPWTAPDCAQAGTVHVGGLYSAIAASERVVAGGAPAEEPFVLVAQQSLFDSSRAPAGKQTAWAYCHVPNGSAADMTERIEAQIERFAPGFRDRILARHAMGPDAMERHNANYVGGDINGGVQDFAQLFTRPVARLDPYSTPTKGLYFCSSSTPPGGGVHGMCGYFAAQSALR